MRGVRGTTSMDRTIEHDRIGPYRLLRPLEGSRHGERWVGLHERDQTTWVVHLLPTCHDRAEERRFLRAMERVASLKHAHVLPIEHYSILPGGRPWAVTAYLGSQVGLVTLESLRIEKGGMMAGVEVERVMCHLLLASAGAHEVGVHHGPISTDEVLVDRSGSVSVEMYGVGRTLDGLVEGNSEIARDEIRSIVELGYFLLTGLPAEEPRIPAGRLVRRMNGALDAWIEEGLSAVGGFESASEALSRLPGRHAVPADGPPRTVKTVIGRVRSALGPR